jgi:small subunit ribosomal protein S2
MKIDFSNLPNKAPEYDLMTLLEAGCHFGHQKAKRHPRMNEYIYAEKDGIHIFDLAHTAKQLQLAYNFVYDQAVKGNSMIMVGTKKQARELIENAAKESDSHYITARWLGGFLTNWTQVRKSLKRMIEIENGLNSGKFDGYTKFEKVQLEKERVKLARFFEGLRELKQLPGFLFVVDIHREKNAVTEAKNMGIPVVAVVDTNSDPEGIDIVIPANDDALKSLSFIINEISLAYQAGLRDASKTGVVKTNKVAEAQSEVKKVETKVEKPEVKVETQTKVEPELKVEVKKTAKPKAKTETKKTAVKKAPAKKTSTK